jgi:hypothetical protein
MDKILNAQTNSLGTLEIGICDLGFGISYSRTPLVIYKVIHGV